MLWRVRALIGRLASDGGGGGDDADDADKIDEHAELNCAREPATEVPPSRCNHSRRRHRH